MHCWSWHLRVIRAEMLQDDHRLPTAVIGNHDSLACGLLTDEILIGTELSVPEHDRGLGLVCAKLAVALDHNAAIGGGVCNRDRLPWRNSQFFRPKVWV